jgi:hypothetical protein
MSEGAPRRRPLRVGGFILMWIVGPIAVLGLLAVGLVRHPPSEALLELVQNQFNKRTGYTLTFDAGSTIKLWPNGEIDLKRVEIRRPALYPTIGGLIADAKTVSARFDLVGLVLGPRAIDLISIEEPTITLHEADVRLLRTNLAESATPGAPPVTLKRLTLTDGFLTYHIRPPNPAFTLADLSAELIGLGRNGVEKIETRFSFNEEPVTVTGNAKRPSRGSGVDLMLSGSSAPATVALEGVAGRDGADGAVFDGEALVQLAEAGPALRWLGIGFEKDHPALAGTMTLTGPVQVGRETVQFSNVLFKSALADGRGEVRANLTDGRIKLSGRVDWDRLDLEGLAQPVRGPRALAVTTRQSASAAQGLVIPSLWEELQDYLKSIEETGRPPHAATVEAPRRGPSAAARLKRFGLAATAAPPPAVDLAYLKDFDLDLAHTAKQLNYNGFDLADVALDTHLEGGRLALKLKQARFASGLWTGTFNVDVRPDQPNLSLALNGTGVEAQRLQQAAAGQSTLMGRGDVRAKLDASGRDAAEIVKTLTGSIKVDIGEGHLVGYDLKAILTQFWRRWSYDKRRRTPFNKVDARVRVDKGVVETIGYASLRGGEAELDSRGTVSLVAQSLNQRIRARLVWPPNQLPLPARISGPWSSPKVSFDWGIFSARPGFFDLPPGLRGEPGAEGRSAFAVGAEGQRAMPKELAHNIERVLAQRDLAARVPAKLRDTLRSLSVSRRATNQALRP